MIALKWNNMNYLLYTVNKISCYILIIAWIMNNIQKLCHFLLIGNNINGMKVQVANISAKLAEMLGLVAARLCTLPN